MLLRSLCTIGLPVTLVALSSAQAADTTLTLACQGTVTVGTVDPQAPVSMGIIVNFTNRTVQGFGNPHFRDYPVNITAWNDVAVAFSGSQETALLKESTIGTIDRVTGDVEATSTATDAKTNKMIVSTSYALKCRPTQRMF